MDQDPLTPLFSPLTTLRGVGPTVGALIAKVAGGERVIDLLFHLPEFRTWIDASARRSPRRGLARSSRWRWRWCGCEPPANERQPWRVVVTDGTGFAELVFFKFNRERQMPQGAKLLVSGKIELFGGRRTMPHPEHVVPADRPQLLPLVEPVWKLTGGLWPRQVASAIVQALARLPSFPEWHDAALLRREKWPGFADALRALQAPIRGAWAPTGAACLRRIAGRSGGARGRRGRLRARPGRGLSGDDSLRAKALSRFGYTLTGSQTQALAEIDADLAADRRMLRLLQGDVGSGKTMVALLAMLRAVEAGGQAAMMAPTEVLAKQHHRTLSRLSPRTGGDPDRRRERPRPGAVAARIEGRRCSYGGRHARAVPGRASSIVTSRWR